jgi:large subunit ribosomal protein L22
MLITQTQKFIRMSPYKIRPVAREAKKLSPSAAVEILPFSSNRAAEPLVKVVKTAIANAKEKGAQEQNLIFKEIQVTEGPMLKRGRPVSRGRWHPFKRRMSHIRVVLQTVEPVKPKKGRVKKITKAVGVDSKSKKKTTKTSSTKKVSTK